MQVEEMAEWRRQGEVLSAKEAVSANGEIYACQQVNSAFQVSSWTHDDDVYVCMSEC
jgi:hypothetical protein